MSLSKSMWALLKNGNSFQTIIHWWIVWLRKSTSIVSFQFIIWVSTWITWAVREEILINWWWFQRMNRNRKSTDQKMWWKNSLKIVKSGTVKSSNRSLLISIHKVFWVWTSLTSRQIKFILSPQQTKTWFADLRENSRSWTRVTIFSAEQIQEEFIFPPIPPQLSS